ncbi:unnamed protein product, partial [Medioppia subpectinata]
MSNNTRSYLSSVNYSCKEGYVLVGRGLLTCDVDERWNGPPPRCEPVICPNPPVIVNSVVRISANNTIFGAVAEYTCDEGYELMGESRIVCNVAGFWDGEPGYCRGIRETGVYELYFNHNSWHDIHYNHNPENNDNSAAVAHNPDLACSRSIAAAVQRAAAVFD